MTEPTTYSGIGQTLPARPEKHYPPVTALVPTVRGAASLGALVGVINQSVAPVRTILYDLSAPGNEFEADRACAWFTNWAGIEVHRGEPFTNASAARNYLMRQVDTEWAWLVDDDVWHHYDALRALRAAVETRGSAAAVATFVDVVPYRKELGHRDWMKQFQFDARPFDIKLYLADTGSVLCRPEDWRDIDTQYIPDARCAEGVRAMTQIALRGGAVCAADAIAVHTRYKRPIWMEAIKTGPSLMDDLQPVLAKERFEHMRRSTGESWVPRSDYPEYAMKPIAVRTDSMYGHPVPQAQEGPQAQGEGSQ